MAKQTFTTAQVLTAAQMTSLQQTAMGGGSAIDKTTSYVLVAADAGTVVQMNAAGATTITVNTALFAAGDTVQIQNIGSGVCTVTAGTATVTTAGSLALSQWEGGQLYFTSTSAAIFFDIVQSSGMTNPLTTTGDTIYSSSGTTPARLGIGSTDQALGITGGIPAWQASSKSTLTTTGDTMYASAANTPARLGIGSTGQVLTVAAGLPSWATPATASSGLTLISRTAFTTSAAVNLNSVFTSTYSNYRVLIYCLSSNNYDFNMRMRASSTDNSTAKYSFQNLTASSTAISGSRTASATAWVIGEVHTTYGCVSFDIFSPQEATQTNVLANNLSGLEATPVMVQRNCGFFNTTQFDGFSIYPAAGTITGTVAVYGYAKA